MSAMLYASHLDGGFNLCMADNFETIPSTKDLVEQARLLISKKKYGGAAVTDYRLAKELGWDSRRISRYLLGQSTLDDEGCQTLADVLDLPLETVLTCIYFERANKAGNDTVSRAWQRICQSVAFSVVPFFAGFFLVFLNFS